ncbi:MULTISPECIES: hypothetical protein [Acidobacteriaceae]|uniref:hypothetical protein n=1 Tax=Acidobacteriaceae TaxID=204434 RepID=UPI00131B0CC0|nr:MULTISPECIES: hypothetical protein [Acidobacteriaceae]MDW5267706.1 hypothetical protein [Edaphobacter sp.]
MNRSDRLRSLLQYLCQVEFSDGPNRITEYDIAVSALGRRRDFSPLEDSAVRSRTYELRQKLEKLYAVEATEYPIRIEIPKGSYRPKFYRVTASVHSPPVPAIASIAEHPPFETMQAEVKTEAKATSRPVWLRAMLAFVAGILVTLFLVAVVTRHSASTNALRNAEGSSRWTPELHALWAPMLSGSRPLLVTFETRLFVEVGPIAVRDPNIENIHDVEASKPIMDVKRLFHVPEVYEARRYADFSVANALFSISQMLASHGVMAKAIRSADLTDPEVHASNLILLGKPGAYFGIRNVNPDSANFVFDKNRRLKNVHPRPGEQALYAKTQDQAVSGGMTTEYGVIRFTLGPEKDQHILTIVSAESELFWPLGQYLTQPTYAKELVDHLRLPSGQLPKSFEVVVKAEFRGDNLVNISYITHRTLDEMNR